MLQTINLLAHFGWPLNRQTGDWCFMLLNHIMKQVESGKMTPAPGAVRLSDFCYCGIFNQVRCADIRENT